MIRASTLLGPCSALAALAVGATVAAQVRPVIDSHPKTARGIEHQTAQDSTVLGVVRSSLADFLWLKVDRVVHNGVDMRAVAEATRRHHRADGIGGDPGTGGHGDDADADDGAEHSGSNTAATHEHESEHGPEETVIGPRDTDWRGLLGDVERATQPFADAGNHIHRDPREALPLFRLMTQANPRFIDGYVTGAYVLSREEDGLDRARQFLEEGIAANPGDLRLPSALGTLLTRKARRYDEALPFLVRAIEIAARRDPATLTEEERDAWQDAVRAMATGRLLAGDKAFAIRAARAGLAVFPDDPTCKRVLAEARAK